MGKIVVSPTNHWAAWDSDGHFVAEGYAPSKGKAESEARKAIRNSERRAA